MADRALIERRLLDLAYTTDAAITVHALAYFAPCTLDEAAAALDDLASRDRVSMTVQDDGTITYDVPGRTRLPARDDAGSPNSPRHDGPDAWRSPRPHASDAHGSYALVPAVRSSVPAVRGFGPSPLVAALLTIVIPGAGHLYAGRVLSAFLWFFAVSAGYALILPGLFLHAFAIGSSAGAAARTRRAPAYA